MHIDLDQDFSPLISSKPDSFTEYVVPVLPEGVKTALAKPVSRLTRLHVWYNPYRQVMTTFTSDFIY